jgi:quercetin dioxygenase-like cupin family protein
MTEIENKKESREEMRNKIMALEASMLDMPGSQIIIEPVHYFSPGIYGREIFIPKGTTLTGKIHKTEHLCVLSKGEVSVWTEDGIKRLTASAVVHSMPGAKRVMHAHEDSVWINFHHNPSNEKDAEKIEEMYVVNSFEELEAFERMKLEEK